VFDAGWGRPNCTVRPRQRTGRPRRFLRPVQPSGGRGRLKYDRGSIFYRIDILSYRSARTMDPKQFHIMVVLAAEPLHGYAIRQEVEERSGGRIRLWPATLYGTLKALAGSGLIEETGSPSGPDDDPRRRYYALTVEGRRRLEREAARLEGLARLARARLALGSA
jgi:DNA-binding PadR family transcriptional regulator